MRLRLFLTLGLGVFACVAASADERTARTSTVCRDEPREAVAVTNIGSVSADGSTGRRVRVQTGDRKTVANEGDCVITEIPPRSERSDVLFPDFPFSGRR